MELAGRVIVVTGGSEGLGAAVVRAVAAEGAAVALCGRRADAAQVVADEVVAAGGEAVAVGADVTVPADLEGLVAAAMDRWGRIDGVVNNAGASAAGRLEDLDDDAWARDIDLKVMAAVRLTRMALPALRRSPAASVVNTLAIAAKAPGAGSEPSSVSRAAGLALTKALAGELGPDGIRVNAVLIGLVRSAQWERVAQRRGVDVEQVYEEMAAGSKIPLGRVGRAEELADVVTFLLSLRSAYVSGVGINVDGGLSPVV